MKTTPAIALLATALIAAGVAMTAWAAGTDDPATRSRHGDMVTGSGRMQSQTRSVASFRAIDARGSMNIILRQGVKEAVEVRADDNLLPLIETTVVDRGGVPTLELSTRPGASYSTHRDVTIVVDVVSLQSIASSGSGDIEGEGLKTGSLKLDVRGSGDVHLKQLAADDFTIRVAGSGDVQASGHAAKVTLSIAGSGDVDTAELDADEVQVKIAGSGDANVNAHRNLGVTIAGSGDVTYAGDPAVKSSIVGSGSVTKR